MFFRKKKTRTMRQDGWLKIDYSDAVIFVRLSGRLDCTLRNTIRPTLGKLLNNETRSAIYLKMDDVFFLDSSTAIALIGFVKDAYRCNASVEVWNASPTVIRVFEKLGVNASLKHPYQCAILNICSVSGDQANEE